MRGLVSLYSFKFRIFEFVSIRVELHVAIFSFFKKYIVEFGQKLRTLFAILCPGTSRQSGIIFSVCSLLIIGGSLTFYPLVNLQKTMEHHDV